MAASTVRKIAVIGAGFVGATLAQRILESGMADVVLVDIAGNLARGKAFDMLDAAPVIGHERLITGTDDFAKIAGSEIVIVTAGLARKPGMTREDLVAKNAAIVKDVALKIRQFAPASIVIIVTNPLDTMTYLAIKTLGFGAKRVFGMAGVLDGARFVQLLAEELNVPRSSVTTYMLGSHGDTMVPVLSQTTVNGKSVVGMLPKDRLNGIVMRARDRGAEIVALYGSGSAYYSPSAAVFRMVAAILLDTGETLVSSALLAGEYGLADIAIGVPCTIGKGGITEIVKLELTADEKASLQKSADAIRATNKLLS